MSYQAVTWVLQNSTSAGVPRLVLLSIASHASAVGHQAHPSTELIASEANCSTRTVFRCIEQLVELGELAYVRNGAPVKHGVRANCRPNLYWLPAMPGCPGHDGDDAHVVNGRRGDTTPGLSDTARSDTTPGLSDSRGDEMPDLGVTSVHDRGDTAVTQIVPRTVLLSTSLSSSENCHEGATVTATDDDDEIEYSQPTILRARAAAMRLGAEDSERSPSRKVSLELHQRACFDTQWLVNGDELLRIADANPRWNARRIAAEFRQSQTQRNAQAFHLASGHDTPRPPCPHCGRARPHVLACPSILTGPDRAEAEACDAQLDRELDEGER